MRYATAEHYMMAGKARLFGDAEAGARVLAADAPRRGQGRRAAGARLRRRHLGRAPLRPRGRRATCAKFGQNPALRDFLLGTGDRVLVEASPLDRVWGIGLAADDEPRPATPARWRGLNLLGFALMEAREQLAQLGR